MCFRKYMGVFCAKGQPKQNNSLSPAKCVWGYFFEVLYSAGFLVGSVRLDAVNDTAKHRRIFALFRTAPIRTFG